jgi:hypothetical protein
MSILRTFKKLRGNNYTLVAQGNAAGEVCHAPQVRIGKDRQDSEMERNARRDAEGVFPFQFE